MNTREQRFPSGRSISRAKQDAKALAKKQQIPLHQALDVVAHEHGFPLGWEAAVQSICAHQADHHIPLGRFSQQDLDELMRCHPRLNDFGIGLLHSPGLCPAQKDDQELFSKNREKLRVSLEAVNKVANWLDSVAKTKTVNAARTSYGIKSLMRLDVGYVTNGVFIAAAILCGFSYKMQLRSPNVMFGMSSRSLKIHRDRLQCRDMVQPAE